MIKAKVSKSLPIVSGVQLGHGHLNPSNHASAGIVTAMPIHTDIAKIFSKKSNAKQSAIKSIKGGK